MSPSPASSIIARRDFPQGDRLFCQVEVYRAVKEEASGMPRVSMGYPVEAAEIAVDQIRTVSKARLRASLGSLSESEAAALRRLISEMYGE